MKSSLNKFIALFCAAVLLAGFTACSAGTAGTSAPEETAGTSASEETAGTSAPEETAGTSAPEAVTPLHLADRKYQITNYAADAYYTRYQIRYSEITLAGDMEKQYPELAGALETDTAGRSAGYDETAEMLEEFSESFFENNPSAKEDGAYLYCGSTPYVLRADSNVLSILYFEESFTGGAHPNRAYDAVTYRTSDGKKLALEDVVTDLNAFAQKVDEKLKEQYPEEYPYFFTDPVQAVKDSAAQEGIMAWTPGYEGMTVWFSPYSLGAYAMGEQVVTICYDEAPELFREELIRASESYIVPLPDLLPVRVDAAGSGNREDVRVETVSVDEYGGCDFVVHRGDTQFRLNTFGYSGQSYLVKENGQYYVYVFVTSDNDYVLLHVVDLGNLTTPSEEGMSAGLMTLGYTREDSETVSVYTVQKELLTDPAAFRLDSHIDFLSTMSGHRLYHTGTDGYPAADEEAYTIRNYLVLKVRRPVTADTVAEDGTVTGSRELLPGTCLFFIRTDNCTYADMQEADEALVTGEETEWYSAYQTEELQTPDWSKPVYRIREDRSDWPGKINGVSEEEVFAGIQYAG